MKVSQSLIKLSSGQMNTAQRDDSGVDNKDDIFRRQITKGSAHTADAPPARTMHIHGVRQLVRH